MNIAGIIGFVNILRLTKPKPVYNICNNANYSVT